jgi:predicted outer membrane repeat protein
MRWRLAMALVLAGGGVGGGLLAMAGNASARASLTQCFIRDLTHHFRAPNGSVIPMRSVQDAVDAAQFGDQLQLRGICHGNTEINKDLDIIGFRGVLNGRPPFPTEILDGSSGPSVTGIKSVLLIGPGVHVHITNLEIRGGSGTPNFIFGNTALEGGGISNFGTLTINNCWITDNTADYGAGIYNHGFSSVTVSSGALVSGNVATVDGGGIFDSDNGALSLGEMTVSGNSAGAHGGGIYLSPQATLVGGLITGNTPDDVFNG